MRELNSEMFPQLLQEVSDDPFLMLIVLEHPDFPETVRLVNNTSDITSRGNTYTAFPMKMVLPPDDGESERLVNLEIDNTGLDLITLFRSITTPIEAKVEMILASDPDEVQMDVGEMLVRDITYDANKISAKLIMDDFLNTEIFSERYTPTNFRGLF